MNGAGIVGNPTIKKEGKGTVFARRLTQLRDYKKGCALIKNQFKSDWAIFGHPMNA